MAETNNSTSSYRSASWLGTNEYEEGDELHERATKFLATTNWNRILSRCSELHGGVPCRLEERYSIGHFNMVRHVVFKDGSSWVARLRMPVLQSVFGDRELLDPSHILKVEISAMKFIKLKTSIPVPTVHDYSLDSNNPIGAAYILMDYIDGTAARDLRQSKNCDQDLFGTPEQDRKFRRRMAQIQAELSSFKFSEIGSLYYNEDLSTFYIGPDVETGKGPWKTSAGYYADAVEHMLRVCMKDAKLEVREHPSFTIPLLFKHLMAIYQVEKDKNGPFSLTNRDFGAHNLLVNDDFDIIGVIDFDGVMSAPIEMVAQYPTLTGLDLVPPGHVETRPAAIARIERLKPRLSAYQKMLEDSQAQIEQDKNIRKASAGIMQSTSAQIVRGLVVYGAHQLFVNEEWMAAYLNLLHQHYSSR